LIAVGPLGDKGRFGAGKEARTPDLNLGKIVTQLSHIFVLIKNYVFIGSLTSAENAHWRAKRALSITGAAEDKANGDSSVFRDLVIDGVRSKRIISAS
jgi:hypothetical protein